MKRITIPPPVEIEGRDKPATFAEFVQMAVDSDERFGRGVKNIRLGQRLLDKAEKANGEMVLEDAECDALKAAAETTPWRPAFARRIISFFDALEGAKDE